MFPAPSNDLGSPPYPFLSRDFSEAANPLEAGIIEQTLDFVRRNTEMKARIAQHNRVSEAMVEVPDECLRGRRSRGSTKERGFPPPVARGSGVGG